MNHIEYTCSAYVIKQFVSPTYLKPQNDISKKNFVVGKDKG